MKTVFKANQLIVHKESGRVGRILLVVDSFTLLVLWSDGEESLISSEKVE